MSIKVGYLNENYAYNNLQNAKSALTLNSFNDSNIILLNTESGTKDDAFIIYKNIIMSGLSSNDYLIHDMQNNKRLMTINNSNTVINNEIQIKDLIHTSVSQTNINSNVHITLKGADNSFIIKNATHELFKIASNSSINCKTNALSLHNTSNDMLLNIETSKTSINNDLYINNGILYTSRISALPGQSLNIDNATYSSTTVEKLIASKNFTVKNDKTDTSDTLPFEIYKNLGTKDVMSINTCNINRIINNFTINNNGLVGIGTDKPDASLTIKKVSDSVINYTGVATGDVFNIDKRGNIGIGLKNAQAQLHVKRNDDLYNENEFRRNPMINLEMIYDSAKNISNIYSALNATFTENATKLYADTKITSNIFDGTLNIGLNNVFYLLNDSIFLGTTMQGNINNISNIILPNSQTLQMPVPQPISTFPNVNVQLTNTLVYPSSNTIYLQLVQPGSSRDNPYYEAHYAYAMMSINTYQSGGYKINKDLPGFNASNFTGYTETTTVNANNTYSSIFNQIIYNLRGYDYKCKIDFIIEKNLIQDSGNRIVSYNFNYTSITKEDIPAPNFLNLLYNNNFISSISSYGTLSLGTQVPDMLKQEYLLYAPGKALLNSLKVNNIDTNQGNDILFNQKNIKNVNLIECQNLQAQNLNMNNIALTQLVGTSVDMAYGAFSNLKTSNLEFVTGGNNYLTFSNSNVHFNTRCSIGKSRELSNSSCLKITVDNEIVPNSHLNHYYNNHNGILILNDSNGINPSLNIRTANSQSIPYIHLNNSLGGYYFRVITENALTSFQIATNNITENTTRDTYFKQNSKVPNIIQHIKEYNTLTFGENDLICIDCETKNYNLAANTNSSATVAIGIPFELYGTSISPSEHVDYFHSTIKQNNYCLNVFGNTKIANIADKPMITAVTQDSKVYTAVNGHPDNLNELRVFGNMCSSNANVYETVSCDKLITSNLLNAYQLQSSNIRTSNLNVLETITSPHISTSNLNVFDMKIYIPDKGYHVSLLDILTNNNLLTFLP